MYGKLSSLRLLLRNLMNALLNAIIRRKKNSGNARRTIWYRGSANAQVWSNSHRNQFSKICASRILSPFVITNTKILLRISKRKQAFPGWEHRQYPVFMAEGGYEDGAGLCKCYF